MVNACVGARVGLELTVDALFGAQAFHLETTALITSFIVSFGILQIVFSFHPPPPQLT